VPSPWPVEILPLQPVACGAVVWRMHGALCVTVPVLDSVTVGAFQLWPSSSETLYRNPRLSFPTPQVTSIEPATTKSGDVNIRLRVSGERDRAVELIRNLEKSQRFIAPRLAGESTLAQEGKNMGFSPSAPGAVEFEIFSGYNPLPEATASTTKASPTAQDGAAHPKISAPSSTPGRHASASPRTRKPQPGARP